MVGVMGIRYYAYPIVAADVDAARACPYRFLGRDPLMDAWGPIDERPNMLYLDKCWWELQKLLEGPADLPARPAAALVAGRVIETTEGWIPHCAVLTPDEVSAVATDLATVTERDVHRLLDGWPRSWRQTDDFAYVAQFLGDAKEVTQRWADAGFGLVFMIG